jgi:hypothetical protein
MKDKMTFQELAKLGAEQLAKQPPVTFEEMKEQILRVIVRGTSKHKGQKETKDQHIKDTLKIHHPDWTQEQIDAELIRLYQKYGQESK